MSRREGRPSATSSSSDDDDDQGQHGAIAVRVKTDVKTEAKMEELREPPEPFKMKRARLMKMEADETAGAVSYTHLTLPTIYSV